MAIFPPDDILLSAATRSRLRPLIDSYKSYYAENVKHNAITQGTAQGRDVWLGRKKWIGEHAFRLRVDDIELLMSFWRKYGAGSFTAFDFEKRLIGSPGYDDAINIGTGTELSTPVNAPFSTSTTGGTLAAGTYWYRVSALNAQGETLASTETSQVTTGTTSTVTVNWNAVAGATGYKIYGRTSGAELFMAQVGAVTTWTDTGAVTPSGALPGANTTGTSTFTLPAKEVVSSSLIVYVAGVQKTAGVHYNLSVGTGTQGEDRVIFTAGNIPTNGQAITAAFLGRCRYTCEIPKEPEKGTVEFNLQTISMTLVSKSPTL